MPAAGESWYPKPPWLGTLHLADDGVGVLILPSKALTFFCKPWGAGDSFKEVRFPKP